MGGLSKKAFQISAVSARFDAPAVIVDAGNLLFESQAVSPTVDDKITAAGIMDIQQLMAVDAVAVGPHDLAAGIDFLLASRRNGFPWLSANLVDRNRSPLFAPSLTITRSGLDIGIIGLTGAGALLPPGTHLADWREILPRQLQHLDRSSDMVIVLSSLPLAEDIEIIKQYPQVDILITADSSQGNMAPTITGQTLMTQTQSQGKYLGQLVIDWLPGHPWAQDVSLDQKRIQERLGIVERRIRRTAQRNLSPGTIDAVPIDRLQQEKEGLLRQLADLRTQQEKIKNGGIPASRFTHSFIGLSNSLQSDTKVAEKISQVKKSIADSHTRNRSTGSPVYGDKTMRN